MIKIHKEGRTWLLILLFGLIIMNTLLYYLAGSVIVSSIVGFISLGFFIFFTYFFRIPNRIVIADENYIVAPADGKIVVIEPTVENGLLKEKRIQEVFNQSSPLSRISNS